VISSSDSDPAEAMRQRLQADLRVAMKGRKVLELAVLRMLIAAIDNAGAVPLSPKSEPPQSEAERRRLSVDELDAILLREHEARRAAAAEFARLGLGTESVQAARELTIVERYLSFPIRR
jgi:uncharacterized protein YqeY